MTTRTTQETALRAWLEGIVGSKTSYEATIIYTHPHGPEPDPPYVRLEVGNAVPIGHAEQYIASSDNKERVIRHMQAEVTVEVVGSDAHSIVEEIDFRRILDGGTLQAAGVSIQSLDRAGVRRVDLGDSWDVRYFLEMQINYRQIHTGNEVYPVTTVVAEGDVGFIEDVEFTTA
jgi:hypothetical protein